MKKVLFASFMACLMLVTIVSAVVTANPMSIIKEINNDGTTSEDDETLSDYFFTLKVSAYDYDKWPFNQGIPRVRIIVTGTGILGFKFQRIGWTGLFGNKYFYGLRISWRAYVG